MKVDINLQNFEKEVLNHKGKVLLDFYADWCIACQMLNPVINSISKQNNIKIATVDIQANPELSKLFKIMSIPTLYLIENGIIKNKKVGALTMPQLNNFIKE